MICVVFVGSVHTAFIRGFAPTVRISFPPGGSGTEVDDAVGVQERQAPDHVPRVLHRPQATRQALVSHSLQKGGRFPPLPPRPPLVQALTTTQADTSRSRPKCTALVPVGGARLSETQRRKILGPPFNISECLKWLRL